MLNSVKSLSMIAILAGGLVAATPAAAWDRDNNPPGPAGGRGTNWENPVGPAGGPGASPNRRHWDRDNNPPGPVGGRGTNWENPPGPAGGPGVSPDRWYPKPDWRRTYWGGIVWVWHPFHDCWFHDDDQNPPGLRGGPGTNWENPPGPIGGPGASPDRTVCS